MGQNSKSREEKSKDLKMQFDTSVDKALKKAVDNVVSEHKRAGIPLAVGREGEVVFVQPTILPVDEVNKFLDNEQENSDRISVFTLNYDEAIERFSERNQHIISFFPKIDKDIYDVFSKISAKTRDEKVIFFLGYSCVHYYKSIVVLCLNGFGLSAMALVRSLFEKCVDAEYLSKNQDKISEFIDFDLVQLKKLGYSDVAEKINPRYIEKIKEFKKRKNRGVTWSEADVVTRAKSVGTPEQLINAYTFSNQFVHSSYAELDISYSELEDRIADRAFIYACALLINVLDNQIYHFDLAKNPNLDEYWKEIEKILHRTFDS